ncbi:flagellar FlbD family protein [Alteribacillus iranensis]|uniref:Flagellar protein FlbD n=1 Tax=Alteribacillus iranensis TaxID=930128 RepID=A0A1I2A4P1_9BACI|nr:flagellar FlbD family protein [Alteribacillus iranensis]SFE38901.1 flagellar protein FlbD [Alteribacillus iranensis]
MIELTKLNGQRFLLSAPLIEQVEALPDTTITLTNGKKLFVKESPKKVMESANAFYRRIGLMGVSIKTEGD